ncbi:MAG: FtsW/RodA/SpoVE family cell cycle protein [Gomphosphaeria aponina SAG 52.96 = DSM 107014]|uniref:Probable peptidoglycan glycosyltransferase FtsW n=1 Tax=Gomphosphaeria aponina SAG 52.96 = DSM 107014 TaxID=1521640 RepID=A0A941GQR2_9CHRO|nr:FtsW/RodA/SpoVE family cell cycle protein [Gomphosphaeria aponina SAG 52.96 = DSM 107014]
MLKYIFPFFDTKVQQWAQFARLLRWLTFLWLLIGLIALFSASFPVAEAESGDGLYYFKRQLIWVWIGLICLRVVVSNPLSEILIIAPWMVLIILGLILATSIPGMGTTVNGATRWLSLGPILIQPSELIKPFLILQSACLFGKWERLSWNFRIGWLIIFATILAGILVQPNLSTTALCGMTIWLMAFAGGLPLRYLGGTALLGILTAVTSIRIHEYQWRRVTGFLNPWADPRGDGYQLVQSLLAIGSGGFRGTGFGLSQQKLFYLPIQYTDFIFAIFAEEFGFLGSVALLIILSVYGTLALLVAMKCRDSIQRLVAIGVMIVMVGQSLLNIGVATGSLPTTGLPLPLFSYGGSSVIASLISAGLLIRVARESNEADVVFLDKRRRQ